MMDIRLYQINRERDEERRTLLSTGALARRGSDPKVIDSSIYDCVFEGTVNCSDLEEVYTLFNVDPPENFSGHSMSVSDVVVEGRTAFFCDSIGFRQVTFDESAARPLHRKIQVVLLEPGKLARPAAIDASLERYQKIVGGMIEAFYPFEEPVCIVCNEEGKLDGLPLNRAVYADPSRREMPSMDLISVLRNLQQINNNMNQVDLIANAKGFVDTAAYWVNVELLKETIHELLEVMYGSWQ